MFDWLPTPLLRLLGAAADNWGWLGGKLNALAINGIVGRTRNRPHPWSTFSPYISWQGLTDKTYQGRHLPATPPTIELPDWTAVAKLFARPAGAQLLSAKSTCLFPAFAQYLTDGFIRTDVHLDDDPVLKRRKTTTNHEIDLCPLYGRTPGQARVLRRLSEVSGQRGQLKSQILNGEEYAPYLYTPDGLTIRPEFMPGPLGEGLDKPLGMDRVPPERLASLFAFGGDRANATPMVAMVNTLLLREHNRLARGLDEQNPGWDDERVFQTARNVLIVMFIKLVVEEYINHITPLPFRLRADPAVAWDAQWNRPNWITAEFSLLYRWHSLMPDVIDWPGGPIPMNQFPTDNRPLIREGVAAAFVAIAGQAAGELGASNTNAFLLFAEEKAVGQARINQMAPYNAYRRAFGQKPAKRFDQISSDPKIQDLLKNLYGTPDSVEFYAGLFAEDRVKNSPLPGLLLIMVAVDAFSQALTNPLLSKHVYNNPETFSAWGRQQIAATATLEDVMRRNVPVPPAVQGLRMTQATWRPA